MKVVMGTPSNNINFDAHRKLHLFDGGLMAVTPAMAKLMTVNFYRTQQTTYCCLWVYGRDAGLWSGSASSTASDRTICSFEQACANANITFGKGDLSPLSDPEKAMMAICKKLTRGKFRVITFGA